ncbi:hypothetical protein [Actinocorallia populi]|uniref:hypothetical protein n=1 Tax=Actinocorallia populi TaxID=2079200 RepID=UPI00130028E4|nr:hypothetical protein [Actinocorallia populi]
MSGHSSRMKLFTKFKRKTGKHHAHTPTRRERAAAERTARAEADLRETEAKIYELADRARRELRRSA